MQINKYIYILLYSIYLIPVESSSIPAGMQLFQWNPVSFWWILVLFLQECKGHQEVLAQFYNQSIHADLWICFYHHKSLNWHGKHTIFGSTPTRNGGYVQEAPFDHSTGTSFNNGASLKAMWRSTGLDLKWNKEWRWWWYDIETFAGWISEAKGQYGVNNQGHARVEYTNWETSCEDDRLEFFSGSNFRFKIFKVAHLIWIIHVP